MSVVPSFPSHITCRYLGVRRLVLSDCADDAYIQWTGTWLVRIMASRPITTNPLLKPKLADSLKHMLTKLGKSKSLKLSFKKGHLNRSSAKWWQVCSGLSMFYQEWGVTPITDWCEADGYGEIDRSLLGSQWPNSGFHFSILSWWQEYLQISKRCRGICSSGHKTALVTA